MITFHFHLQPQYKYQLFHINFTLIIFMIYLMAAVRALDVMISCFFGNLKRKRQSSTYCSWESTHYWFRVTRSRFVVCDWCNRMSRSMAIIVILILWRRVSTTSNSKLVMRCPIDLYIPLQLMFENHTLLSWSKFSVSSRTFYSVKREKNALVLVSWAGYLCPKCGY